MVSFQTVPPAFGNGALISSEGFGRIGDRGIFDGKDDLAISGFDV